MPAQSHAFPIDVVAETHDVTNQPPAFAGYDCYAGDAALREAVSREGAAWIAPDATALAAAVTSERVQDLARAANRHSPELKTHDRWGRRVDLVEFHPAYHELMKLAFGAGVHSLAWTAKRPGAHVARAALSFLWNQIENGVGCPTGMAYASIPALRRNREIAAVWGPAVLSNGYDPRPLPVAEKKGATIGMALTEKQGGSDLRANTTHAEPVREAGDPRAAYRLTGHKWFCSAPLSDAFFTLAYTKAGPSCFFVPRSLPDGTRNPFQLQRLKDKCGNRSNASSEVEFRGTHAILVGEEGRGIRTALEMAHLTRLDFAVGSAGLMRLALSLTLHHADHRLAFQKRLIDQPLMRSVVADLALESEAATALAIRLAGAIDRSATDQAERLLERVLTPVAKYWVCKRAPMFVAEAMECLGGNGYVEEGPLARLYREAPLNNIWEGSGNLVALDFLRAIRQEPDTIAALAAEFAKARGADRRLDLFLDCVERDVSESRQAEAHARRLVETVALAVQGCLLVRHSPAAVGDAFVRSRLDGEAGRMFGAVPRDADTRAIVDRARLA
jgi:putative acyl-CoA dehydrogenase